MTTISKGWIRMKCSFHRNSACKSCNAFIKVLQNEYGTETKLAGGEHAFLNNGTAHHHDQERLHQSHEEFC